MNPGWIEGRTSKEIEAGEEPSRRAAVPQRPAFPGCEVMEEPATDACGPGNRALKPGVFLEPDAAPRQLHPLLGRPVAESTTWGHRIHLKVDLQSRGNCLTLRSSRGAHFLEHA
jgi:hypothetical protein